MKVNLNEYFRKKENFSGSVLISKDKEIIFNESYGYSNKEKKIQNTSDTKFMLGSITKSVTALCIMQLAERNMLSTKQNINDFFPDLYTGQGITIHHLLTHTSGIPNYILLKKQIKWNVPHTPQGIMQVVKGYKLKFPPGDKWAYSNTNYLILGLIIECVSGMPYHHYVKEYIFNAAKMNSSGFVNEEQANLANNYINGKKGFYIDPTMWFACGDMVSSVGDLYLLNRAIQDGNLLKAKTVDEMIQVHYDGKFVKYGYGLLVKNHFGGKSICHGGSIPNGFTTHFEKYLDDDIAIIVLSNDLVKHQFLSIKGAGGTYISREIASQIYGKKLGPLKKIF